MSTITIPRPGPAVLTSPVNVSLARTRADLDAFVDLPFRLYAGDRSWVPPLRADRRKQLDPARNPYFAHAEAGLFLARRGGRVVGRISAHTDEQYNAFHSVDGQVDSTGFFGFFECEDDPEATQALLEAAARWLAKEGKATMVGPASFTLNDVAGLLINGFGAPPIILMTYNPPYYEGLLDGAGLEKVQDLYAYQLETSTEAPADIVEFARSAEEKFTFRPMDMRRFDEELVRFLGVYNQAWERNWGFCPLTEEEIQHHAKDLKPIIDPNLVIIAEQDGEPVGAGLTLPDVNQVLVRSRGRLGPVTLARLLYRAKRRRWDVCRVFALGVKKGYRETGIGAHLYLDTLRAAQRGGYRWGEMSWILESNDAMNRAIRHMGGRVYKTYRMYGRATG